VIACVKEYRGLFHLEPLVLGLVSFGLMFPFTSIGVDPHHDGIMLHPALVGAKGGVLYRDVFLQYGPVPTWIHSVGIVLIGPTLYAIRIVSVFQLSLTFCSLFFINRRLFNVSVARLAFFLGLLCIYFLDSDYQHLPWHTDSFNLFLAFSVLGVLQSESAEQKCKFCQASTWLVLATAASFLALLCRLLPGVILIFLLLSRNFPRRRYLFFVGSTLLICCSSFFVYLLLTSSLEPFWTQTVVGPFRWGTSTHEWLGIRSVFGRLVRLGLPTAGVILLLVKASEFAKQRVMGGASLNALISSFVTVCVVALIWLVGLESVLTVEGVLWSCLGLTGLLALQSFCRALANKTEPPTLLLLTASTVAIFPISDFRHLFWAAVPVLGIGCMFLAQIVSSRRVFLVLSGALVLILGAPRISSIRELRSMPLVSAGEFAVLEGMRVPEGGYFDSFVSPHLELLGTYLPDRDSFVVLNFCTDGLYASLGSNDFLADRWFVNWFNSAELIDAESVLGAGRVAFAAEYAPVLFSCPPSPSISSFASFFGATPLARPSAIPSGEEYDRWPFLIEVAVPRLLCAELVCSEPSVDLK